MGDEAGVDPAFVELDEEASAELYDRAFRAWIERKLGEMPEGLRRALSRLAAQRSFDGSSPLERLREAGAPARWAVGSPRRRRTTRATGTLPTPSLPAPSLRAGRFSPDGAAPSRVPSGSP